MEHPTVLAHAFGDRYELPVPLLLFVLGGAAVVVLSFLMVLARPTRGAADPVITGLDSSTSPDAQPPRPLPAAVAIAVWVAIAVIGATGTQVTSANLAPTVFWVLFWIGVPLSCGVIGDWSRPINPFGLAARLGDSPRLRRQILARRDPLAWSPKVGRWPAVGLFILTVLGELVFQLDATRPEFVGEAILIYLIVSFAGGLMFGAEWLRNGEVFSCLFDTWGRLGYFRFQQPGERGFFGGLRSPIARRLDEIVFALLLLISINFDGLLATPQWARFEIRTLGPDPTSARGLRIGSLAGCILLVLALFTAFAWASCRSGRFSRTPLLDLSLLLPSLVPIAYGYLVAHYLQYLLTNGQLLIPELGNPGYPSWPLTLPAPFNSEYVVNTALLPNSFYWYLSVLVIVAVHVVAVVLAHDALAARAAATGLAPQSAAGASSATPSTTGSLPDRRDLRVVRSEMPWLVAMVGYTALSLFLIAQPLTVPRSEQPRSASAPTSGALESSAALTTTSGAARRDPRPAAAAPGGH